MTPKSGPGTVLGDLGAPFGVLRAIFKEFLRRLARRWAQDGRSWGQVGSKLRPRWAKIAPSWRSWAQLGRFWEHVGSIFGLFWHMGWIAENLQKCRKGKHSFFRILGCLEGAVTRKSSLGAAPGRSRGTFWRPARDFLKNSAQVGAKMGTRWAKLRPSCDQDGP